MELIILIAGMIYLFVYKITAPPDIDFGKLYLERQREKAENAFRRAKEKDSVYTNHIDKE